MKKCASCTKDLPDAALHCVFCGAKQPPAPAAGMAKTAFGYDAQELRDQQRQRPATGAPPPRPLHQQLGNAPTMIPQQQLGNAPTMIPQQQLGNAPTMISQQPQPQPFATAQSSVPPPPQRSPLAMAATQAVPAYPGTSLPPGHPMAPPPAPPIPAPSPPPMAPPPMASGLAPASHSGAATLYAPQPGPAPQGSFGRSAPMQPTLVPQPLQAMVPPPPQMHAPQPMAPPPMAPPQQMPAPMAIPAAMAHHYQTSPTATNVRRPMDPWRDSLRAMMFIWGLLLLIAFATPLATKPGLVFAWTGLFDAGGKAMLPALTIAAVGLLGVLLAFVPMPTPARGLLATVLGLAGLAVPIALVGVPPWQALAPLVGALVLLPGLIVRSEYLASIVPRLMVTLGVLAMLAIYLVPQHDTIPLVGMFKQLIEAPGSAKVGPGLQLGMITILVMALLAWLPSPATGGAKVWAWLLLLWPLVSHVVDLVLKGGIADRITGSPNEALVGWIAAGGTTYLVFIAYGLASVVGKQLE